MVLRWRGGRAPPRSLEPRGGRRWGRAREVGSVVGLLRLSVPERLGGAHSLLRADQRDLHQLPGPDAGGTRRGGGDRRWCLRVLRPPAPRGFSRRGWTPHGARRAGRGAGRSAAGAHVARRELSGTELLARGRASKTIDLRARDISTRSLAGRRREGRTELAVVVASAFAAAGVGWWQGAAPAGMRVADLILCGAYAALATAAALRARPWAWVWFAGLT